jgi:hypothetical protein
MHYARGNLQSSWRYLLGAVGVVCLAQGLCLGAATASRFPIDRWMDRVDIEHGTSDKLLKMFAKTMPKAIVFTCDMAFDTSTRVLSVSVIPYDEGWTAIAFDDVPLNSLKTAAHAYLTTLIMTEVYQSGMPVRPDSAVIQRIAFRFPNEHVGPGKPPSRWKAMDFGLKRAGTSMLILPDFIRSYAEEE